MLGLSVCKNDFKKKKGALSIMYIKINFMKCTFIPIDYL